MVVLEHNYNGHILASDFNNLSTNQDKEIDIYYLSNNGRQYRRDIYNVKKNQKSKFSIIINKKLYKIDTTLQKKKEIKNIKSEENVKQQWNEKIGELNEELDKIALKISEYKNKDLNHAKNHLFVDSKLAMIAFKNLDTTKSNLAKLRLDLEKLRNFYEKIY